MSKFEERKKDNRQKAVALRYRAQENNAPVVIASGYGQIADKIIGIAEEKGIPVYKDDSAASMLCMLEVGRDIPPDLYQVVAAVYMQIITLAGNLKNQGADGAAGNGGGLDAARELRRRLTAASLGQNPGKEQG